MAQITMGIMMSRHIDGILDGIAFIEAWFYAFTIVMLFICEQRKTLKIIFILGLAATQSLVLFSPILGLSILPFIITVLYLGTKFEGQLKAIRWHKLD